MSVEAFRFTDIFIGRTPEQDRVYVDIEWDSNERLSLTGVVVEPRKREPIAAGQIVDRVERVNPRLAELWRRWHLNDMRAGCEHQERLFRDTPALRPSDRNNYRGPTGIELGTPCEHCGYRYGTAWLYEPVPDDVIIELRDMLQHDVVF